MDINTRSSWFMRKEQQQAIEKSRNALASFLKCDPEELVITRNTTESLNTVISGYPWKKGDEVVLGNQDYGSMVAAFEQQAKRYGIVLKVARIPLHPKNDEELVDSTKAQCSWVNFPQDLDAIEYMDMLGGPFHVSDYYTIHHD